MVDETDRDGCSPAGGMDGYSRPTWLRCRRLGARLSVEYRELHDWYQPVRRRLRGLQDRLAQLRGLRGRLSESSDLPGLFLSVPTPVGALRRQLRHHDLGSPELRRVRPFLSVARCWT